MLAMTDKKSEFRPKLPRDPFKGIRPMSLSLANLQAASEAPPTQQVILIIGTPTLEHITPLLTSPRFRYSLLILATNQPPDLSSHFKRQRKRAGPAVHVLRLQAPPSSASDFAILLENAQRVSRKWRRRPKSEVCEVVFGADEGGQIAMSSEKHRCTPSSTFKEALSTCSSLFVRPTFPLPVPSLYRKRSRTSRERIEPRLKRPFDALLHFLPESEPEKHLLQRAILVTTVCAPFLLPLSPTPVPERAHVLHLLPPARERLIASLDAFLRCFGMGEGAQTRAYVMLASVLTAKVPGECGGWTAGEVVLAGLIDEPRKATGTGDAREGPDTSSFSPPSSSKEGSAAKVKRSLRGRLGEIAKGPGVFERRKSRLSISLSIHEEVEAEGERSGEDTEGPPTPPPVPASSHDLKGKGKERDWTGVRIVDAGEDTGGVLPLLPEEGVWKAGKRRARTEDGHSGHVNDEDEERATRSDEGEWGAYLSGTAAQRRRQNARARAGRGSRAGVESRA